MASFDFIDSSSRGYEFVWSNLSYLLRVAIPVLFVKIACDLAAFLLGFPLGSLGYGLVILPGYAVEAVFLVGLIRYFAMEEPIYVWGRVIPPPNLDKAVIPFFVDQSEERKTSMMAGAVMYVLISLFAYAIAGLGELMQDSTTPAEPPADVNAVSFIFGILFLGAVLYLSIWMMRILYCFIPLTLGWSLKRYLRAMRGIKASFSILLTLLLCMVPLYIIFSVFLNILGALFMQEAAAYIVLEIVLRNLFYITVTSIQVVAITQGICHIMSGQKNG